MHILRIEYQIHNFDSWKAAFDSDPAGRQQSGAIATGFSDPSTIRTTS